MTQPRMRVLHVTGCYPPATEWGGVPAATLGMAHALGQVGVDVDVFATTQRSSRDRPPITPGTREMEGTTATYFSSIHSLGRSFFAPGLASTLWSRVREFDLVHLHMLWTFPSIAAAAICRARHVPYVVSLHGALDPWALRQRRLEKRLFLALAERRNLQKAALLHFTFEAERAVAPEWVQRLPAIAVPLPVDAAPFLTLGRAADRARSHDVLILARVHPMKGFDVLIPAMKQVVSREPRARLIVAGPDEGSYLAQVRRIVIDAGLAGRVEFAGLLDTAARARALTGAAVMVAPSYRENFGLSVAEGMAAGLPVIVSDKVNIGGDVTAAGAGMIVPLDSTQLADALLRLLAAPDLRERMGDAGRRLVAERYSPKTVGASLARAYQRVIRLASDQRSASK